MGKPGSRDPILEGLQAIFSSQIGSSFEGQEEEDEKRNAQERIQRQEPPGYKDAGKKENHGDYFVWAQTLREVKRRQAKVLVLVTGDVKEDWYLRIKGQTIMARPELVRECKKETGAALIMITTKSLLYYAEDYLHAKVSDETIRQAERISTRAKSSLMRDVEAHMQSIQMDLAQVEHNLAAARERCDASKELLT